MPKISLTTVYDNEHQKFCCKRSVKFTSIRFFGGDINNASEARWWRDTSRAAATISRKDRRINPHAKNYKPWQYA